MTSDSQLKNIHWPALCWEKENYPPLIIVWVPAQYKPHNTTHCQVLLFVPCCEGPPHMRTVIRLLKSTSEWDQGANSSWLPISGSKSSVLEQYLKYSCSNNFNRSNFLCLNREKGRMQNEKQSTEEWCNHAFPERGGRDKGFQPYGESNASIFFFPARGVHLRILDCEKYHLPLKVLSWTVYYWLLQKGLRELRTAEL